MTYTVLIIDDEKNARENISKYLEKRGYETCQAGSIKESNKFIKEGIADIIVLDVQLPDGYGVGYLSELSKLPNRPPVILITGHGDIES